VKLGSGTAHPAPYTRVCDTPAGRLGRVCKPEPDRGYPGFSPVRGKPGFAEEPVNGLRDRAKAGLIRRSRSLQTRPSGFRCPADRHELEPACRDGGLRTTSVRARARPHADRPSAQLVVSEQSCHGLFYARGSSGDLRGVLSGVGHSRAWGCGGVVAGLLGDSLPTRHAWGRGERVPFGPGWILAYGSLGSGPAARGRGTLPSRVRVFDPTGMAAEEQPSTEPTHVWPSTKLAPAWPLNRLARRT